MKRRDFLKYAGIGGASVFVPSSLNLVSLYKNANAAVQYDQASIITPPAIMPQVINVFLYGGPSELAGNLTNITAIENGSQNSYESVFNGITQPTGSGGLVTPNGFWRGAGGDEMEFMVTNNYMSVYRTLMKRKDPTGSHRESLLMSQKGSLDIETSAGVGTRMAALLSAHATKYQINTQLADSTAIPDINGLLLPFVSFEGESRIFAQDPDVAIPLEFRGLTLDNNFDNPFTRNSNNPFNVVDPAKSIGGRLDALVNKVMAADQLARYSKAVDAFKLRAYLETKIGDLSAARNQPLNTMTAGSDIAANTVDANGNTIAPSGTIIYPNTSFARTLRSAVTLAIHSPSTVFISVGGSLGGWDDHNNGVDDYPDRMTEVMRALRAAMWQIKYSQGIAIATGNTRTTTNNIVINVFGDFGRRVNLNNSMGWDHGNNQNLYTLGGAGLQSAAWSAPRQMGKVVGTTVWAGSSGTNDQVTVPAPGSYEFEPMSVAASLYSYLGVENPEILTRDDVRNPNGDPAIDETQ